MASYTLVEKPRYIAQNNKPVNSVITGTSPIDKVNLIFSKNKSSNNSLFADDTTCLFSNYFLIRKWDIPPIKFIKKPYESTLKLNDLFGVKDSNTLVIAISNRSLNYIVYYPNGKITVFKSSGKIGDFKKSIFKAKKINRKNTNPFDSLLQSEFEIHGLWFNQDSLNIDTMIDESGMKNWMSISHGGSYSGIWVWTLNGFSSFWAYEPYAYINGKFPGSSERIKLMNFIERYQKLIKTIE